MSDILQPPIPLADLPPGNRLYLLACETSSDPSMVWGTEVQLEPLRNEIARLNRDGTFLLTPVHVLVKAVERAVAAHPELNRRVLRGQVRPYRGQHLLVSTQRRDGRAGVVHLQDVQEMSVEDIGRAIWTKLLEERAADGRLSHRVLTRRRYPLMRILGPRISGALFRKAMGWMDRRGRDLRGLGLGPGAPVLVNYLGGHGMPPMRSFRPSRLPLGYPLTSVTIGAPEQKPVATDTGIEARWVAPVHVRSDHRLVDGIELGRFTATIKDYVEHPERLR
ncbi:MAG TPA: 2-oxo acid dehydrogenase subunit E2 [Gemmatimonadota bacterium]|nr:2-oxo acid dehydrogenase subunit E2 [Gemmatimonadota bacterium]